MNGYSASITCTKKMSKRWQEDRWTSQGISEGGRALVEGLCIPLSVFSPSTPYLNSFSDESELGLGQMFFVENSEAGQGDPESNAQAGCATDRSMNYASEELG